tara:strand:+ start:84 stop:494 length:411 start_codon:yes stop_codon:yes gene_type:complete
MKKILLSLLTIILLNGCAETLAFLGTSASSGKIVQSSLNSAISYGIKKQSGKTPLEHVAAYVKEKNPEKKQETCISSLEITRSELCSIMKKKISSSKNGFIEKTPKIVKKYPKNYISKEISKIEEIARKSVIYNRR